MCLKYAASPFIYSHLFIIDQNSFRYVIIL